MKRLAWLFLMGAGCTAHFERAEMQERLHRAQPLFTDWDVERIEQLKPQLPMPFRLAVAPPVNWSGDPTSERELQEIKAWGEKLEKAGVITDLVVIPSMLLQMAHEKYGQGHLKAIRAASARFHADAVLVLATVTDVDAYVNPLSVLYLTIVGMMVVPGSHREALTLVEGVLLDNRNEYLYTAVVAEGKGFTTGPLVGIEDADAIRDSRVAALRSFGEEFVKKASAVRPAPSYRRYETPK